MALLTNSDGFSEHGVSQSVLVNHILHLEAALAALCAKLDGDSGVNDTDFGGCFRAVIASGAAPIVDANTFATIVAQFTTS